MNKNLLIILAAIFGLLLIITLVPYGDQLMINLGLTSQQDQLIPIPKNLVSVEFFTGSDNEPINSLVLQNDEWFIDDYLVNNELMDRLLEDLGHLEVDSLVSTNPEKFTSYGASESSNYVRVKNLSGEESEIIIGLDAIQPGAIYLRPRLENKVYLVASDLRNFLLTTKDEWRDKFILDENPESISSIEISKKDQKIIIQPNEQGQWQANFAGETRIIGEVALERLFDVLSPLEGRGIASNAQERLFEVSEQQVYVTINPIEGSEPLRLVLLDDQDNSVWLIKLEDGEYLYTINPAVANTLVETNFTLFE